jgi:hypothetical protein
MNYRQCVLKKQLSDEAYEQQVSWIPEPFCVTGKVLKLQNTDGTWENGWIVTEAGEPQPASYVEEHSRDWLKTRKASDI